MKLSCPGAACAAFATLTLAAFSPATAAGICALTTAAAKGGCDLQASSDYNYTVGACANLSSATARVKCLTQAANAHAATKKLCIDQVAARNQVCDAIGQAAYNPEIVPQDFSATITNPLLPWKPGSVWVYRNLDTVVTVQVLTRTFKVAGVTCVVVHDVGRINGQIEEDTVDYYAQHKDGSVWYFGEDTIAFHDGIPVTEGSWRAGLDGSKPGIAMPAHPLIGRTYRQEFRLGVAEDIARNIAANQHVTVPFGTFNNAFEIHETTPVEPVKSEDKYYVPGVGNVLAVNLVTGEREALVSFTPGP